MIKNIWAYLDKIQAYLKANTTINTLFWGRIYAWRPIGDLQGKSLFFSLINNSIQVAWDRNGTIRKKASFEFYIIGGGKWVPEVELYEALDVVSNEIITECSTTIDLDGFFLHSIEEWNQSGILRDAKDNPFLIATYNISYTYKY